MAQPIFNPLELDVVLKCLETQLDVKQDQIYELTIKAQSTGSWEELGNVTIDYFNVKSVVDKILNNDYDFEFDEYTQMIAPLEQYIEMVQDDLTESSDVQRLYDAVAALAKIHMRQSFLQKL